MDSLMSVVIHYRKRAGLRPGDSARRVVEQLVELFPDLTLVPSEVKKAALFCAGRYGQYLLYSRELRDWAWVQGVGHELAHLILITEGWALPRPVPIGGNPGRLIRAWDAREEALAERLLQYLLCGEADVTQPEEAAEQIGCPLEYFVAARQHAVYAW